MKVTCSKPVSLYRTPQCFPRGVKQLRQTSGTLRFWAEIWESTVGQHFWTPLPCICCSSTNKQFIVYSLNQTHFVSQDTGCFTINMSLIGQTDLTSYFTWADHMICHLPPRISRAVEVGWDQNTSSYEDCDTEGSKIATLNLPMWPSGTGFRVNLKFWWEFELSYVTKGEVCKICFSVARNALMILLHSICPGNLKRECKHSLDKSLRRRNHTLQWAKWVSLR
jgi:hypothetical protein